MNERIAAFAQDVIAGKVYFETTPTEYSREDLLLHPMQMQAKRAAEYILNQTPQIRDGATLTGYLRFDGSCEGNVFELQGFEETRKLLKAFYPKPYLNLVTCEWQHSVGNFLPVIQRGIQGLKEDIAASKARHSARDELAFLEGADRICDAIIGWAHKCADSAEAMASATAVDSHKQNLLELAAALRNVPEKPAATFHEAILCLYVCFSFIPDSIGTLDRNLYPYYKRDIERGILTEERAKEYLQELFLMLQAKTSIKVRNFYRGGESHFCIGGYLEDGTDCFNEFSRLIVDSLMELPTYCPQISLRWTKKTPREVLRYMMDCERKDPNKRIAFVSDEPRIKAFEEIVGLSHKDAVNYCMCGCNEPALPGGRIMGSSQQNIARSMANTFQNRGEDLLKAETFDAFYAIYEQELFADMGEMLRIDNIFNEIRARDCGVVSSLFFKGCIENAKSVTQGGADITTATMDIIGVVTVIDCLSIVKQVVYDEKWVSMAELVDAVQKDWEGYEDLRTLISKKGKFFGNDDSSNEVAQRFTTSIYEYLQDKRDFMGKKYLVGNLIGYNQHNVWFGNQTAATPDGRHSGDMISFGIGQSEGRDRNGLSALLNSVAKHDPTGIMNGVSVTNVLIDEALVHNDESFEKLVLLFETYFKNGGNHFQLSYVSKEDLLNAQKTPDKYRHLRVRVSGFSDFFVNLNEDLQEEIITRTVVAG